MKILSLGKVSRDRIYRCKGVLPDPPDGKFPAMLVIRPGGGATNASFVCRHFGEVTLVVAIGTDAVGRGLFEECRRAGINLLAQSSEQATAESTIFAGRTRKEAFRAIPMLDGESSNSDLDLSLIFDRIPDYDILSISNNQDPDGTVAAIGNAVEAGVLVAVNPGSGIAKQVLVKEVIERVDILQVDQQEAASLLGDEAKFLSPGALVGAFAARSPAKVVVITAGDKGAYAHTGNQALYQLPFLVGEDGDSTGCGDAAFGAFTANYKLSGGDVEYALKCAAVAGGLWFLKGHFSRKEFHQALESAPGVIRVAA